MTVIALIGLIVCIWLFCFDCFDRFSFREVGGTLGAPDINTTLPRTRKSHSHITADAAKGNVDDYKPYKQSSLGEGQDHSTIESKRPAHTSAPGVGWNGTWQSRKIGRAGAHLVEKKNTQKASPTTGLCGWSSVYPSRPS